MASAPLASDQSSVISYQSGVNMKNRTHPSTVVTGALALGLALGWSAREAEFARAQGKRIPNGTVNRADVRTCP
jgi:hypothetical protein